MSPSAMMLWLCGALALSTVSGRQELNFNYGWRFAYLDPSAAGPGTCSFPESLDNMDCTGLERNPNRFNFTDCEQACCYNPDCLWWQQAVGPKPQFDDRTCLHGSASADVTCKPSDKPNGMVGGRRRSSPSPAFLTNRSRGAASYDDSDWERVVLPHDFVARNGTITADADSHRGYFTRGVGWYRKRFSLPDEWKNDAIFVRFEGAFHVAEVYWNGQFLQSHSAGYLGFTVRLDNATTAGSPPRFASDGDKDNVLAVRVDGSFGSGHWYEGGGLWRGVQIVSVSKALHITEDGVFVQSQVKKGDNIPVEVEVEGFGLSSSASVYAKFTLYDKKSGGKVGSCDNSTVSVSPDSPIAIARCEIAPEKDIELWSTASPRLYVVSAQVGSSPDSITDAVNVTSGFRSAEFDSEKGFSLNGQSISFRGFSHHHSFAGLGAAAEGVERLQLFKAQASRALGSNVWRMSHNPYGPALYSILDRLGTAVWDENRDYGAEYVFEMHDMVKRDRNHPSVVIWSTCNEYECLQLVPETTAKRFYAAAKAMDPTRPVTANNNGQVGEVGQAGQIDVQGFSHKKLDSFTKFHQSFPKIPLVLSECCSCDSQRAATPNNTFDSDLSADRDVSTCEPQQNAPGLASYVTGSLGVWTLFDYFGEPNGVGGWPKVSCSFGQFDIAGFPKPHAYWYAATWLAAHRGDAAGVPSVSTPAAQFVRILSLPDDLVVESAEPSTAIRFQDNCSFPTNLTGRQCKGLKQVKDAKSSDECEQACCSDDKACSVWQYDLGPSQRGCWVGRADPAACEPNPEHPEDRWVSFGGRTVPSSCTVSVLATTPQVQLTVGGQSFGVQNVSTGDDGKSTATAYFSVPCDLSGKLPAGTEVKATGLSSNGDAVASDSVSSPGSPAALELSVDSPSPTTGTGTKLVLDGRDTALVRAALVDASGALVSTQSVTVTFSVSSGPARVVGTGNGDSTLHGQPSRPDVPTFAGLARGLIQVTADCASEGRDAIRSMDSDGGAIVQVLPDGQPAPAEKITITARAEPGGFTASVDIDVSCDMKDAAMAVAEQSGSEPLEYSYLVDFRG